MLHRCLTNDMEAILKSPVTSYFPPETYLAGGTAVALYFNHRLSIDFDFFTREEFDSLALVDVVSKEAESHFRVARTSITENTLVLNLNETGFSLFTYRYPLLSAPSKIKNIPFPVASKLDLALMKFVAINQRGSCKDFIDLKMLIQNGNYAFQWLAEKLSSKYKIGEEMHFQLKKSLVYFDDAEKDLNVQMYDDHKGSFELLKREDWKTTKEFFLEFVKC